MNFRSLAKALLVVAAVFVIGRSIGWLTVRQEQVRVQRQILEQVELLGGVAYYDFHLKPDGSLVRSQKPSRLGSVLPVDWWHDVFYITFAERPTNIKGSNLAIVQSFVADEFLRSASKLTSLRWLALNGTGVSQAGIAAVTSKLPLQKLWLGQTAIDDAALESISKCKTLTLVSLEATPTSDVGLEKIVALPALEFLSLGSPSITTAGLQAVARARQLKELHLDLMPVTDQVLNELARLEKLEVLSIRATRISDAASEPLGKLSRLRTLNLDGTAITSSFWQTPLSLPQLEQLSCERTATSDTDLKALADCRQLHRLNVHQTQCTLSGTIRFLEDSLGKSLSEALEIVAKIKTDKQQRIVSLDATGFAFNDADLAILTRLPDLQWLSLPGNALSDSGFAQLANMPLPSLSLLDISRSSASDSSLQELSSLPNLKNIQAAQTQISESGVQTARQNNPSLTVYTTDLASKQFSVRAPAGPPQSSP